MGGEGVVVGVWSVGGSEDWCSRGKRGEEEQESPFAQMRVDGGCMWEEGKMDGGEGGEYWNIQ